jgi:uncharacterized protein (TIGR03437 family)
MTRMPLRQGMLVFLIPTLLMLVRPPRVLAQNFDTSGTASLSGSYFFRYVNFYNDSQGNLTESCSLTGVMMFNGAGSYTLSNTQLYDSLGTNGSGSCALLGGGNYGVQSNGIAQLDNPLYAATLFGTFSKPVLTASSTEDDYFDLFIAVQAPPSSSNASLSGNFTVGALDFLNASTSLGREGWFTMTADGKGNIAPFTVTGATAALGSVSQSVLASTYTLSGVAGGTLTFPGSATSTTEIISGARTLYVSADGNFILAGSTAGSDMIFGFRAPSGSSTGSSFNGTYFLAGMAADLSGSCSTTILYCLDAFYGSMNTNGNGNTIWHERLDDVVDVQTYDNTFNLAIPTGPSPPYDGTYYYLASANGQAVMSIGSQSEFSLSIGVQAPAVAPPSGVWINPIGVLNAANYTPITNAYAPGEIVALSGNFGVLAQSSVGYPVPTELGNVKVLVNGLESPVLFVSNDQIYAIIPYEVSGDYFDTFQVVVNGSKSNSVTVYADSSAPGFFTLPGNGLGGATALHANGNEVTDSDPATAGERIKVFLTGLGVVTPAIPDGVAGPVSPLSYSNEYLTDAVAVYLDDGVDFVQAGLTFAGTAPGAAGLDRMDFTLPTSGLVNGDVHLTLETNEAQNEMATIAVTGYSQRRIDQGSSHALVRPGRHAPGAGVAHGRTHVESHRRGLPARQSPAPRGATGVR